MSPFDSSLLVYRNTTEFCVLILYLTTLLNSFINSNSFFWWILKGTLYMISYHLQIVTVLLLFSNWTPFISFSCLIALARTSNTMLNKSSESGQTYLVPKLRGKAFHFSHFEYDVSWGLIICDLYYVEVYSLYTHFVESFYHKLMLNFVKCFLYIYWDDHIIVILHFGNVLYHTDWFAHVEPSLHSWNKPHLIMLYDPLNLLLNLIC